MKLLCCCLLLLENLDSKGNATQRAGRAVSLIPRGWIYNRQTVSVCARARQFMNKLEILENAVRIGVIAVGRSAPMRCLQNEMKIRNNDHAA
jgi:hypothetical protein